MSQYLVYIDCSFARDDDGKIRVFEGETDCDVGLAYEEEVGPQDFEVISLDDIRSVYDELGLRPKDPPARDRRHAAARLAIEQMAERLEDESFSGATQVSIYNEDTEVGEAGEIDAVAYVAVGWQAQYLKRISELINFASRNAIADSRAAHGATLKNVAEEAAKTK